MFKKIAFALGVLGLLTGSLTGCTNTVRTNSDEMLSISRINDFVTPGKTTIDEARELIGTPTITGKTVEGNKFVGFSVSGQESAGRHTKRLLVSALTIGIAADNEFKNIQKNIYFVLDKNNVVIDMKSVGYAYIYDHSIFGDGSLCQRELTEEELNSTTNYPKEYIIDSWKKYILSEKPADVVAYAQKEDVSLDEIDYDDFPYTENSFIAYAQKGAHKFFGNYTNEETFEVSGGRSSDGKNFYKLLQ